MRSLGIHYKVLSILPTNSLEHDDVIKWKHFPRSWPFVRGILRSPVNSPHKGQWRGALIISLICVWINDWVNNREAGDLRCYRAHNDVIVMIALLVLPFCLTAGGNLCQYQHTALENMMISSCDPLTFFLWSTILLIQSRSFLLSRERWFPQLPKLQCGTFVLIT